MPKKLLILLTTITLLGMLSACTQAQPNEGTLATYEGALATDDVDKFEESEVLQDMYDIIEFLWGGNFNISG